MPAEHRELIEKCVEGSGATLMKMSNKTEAGVDAVKATACDALLQNRVESRLGARKVDAVLNRVTVAMPPSGAQSEAFIPPSVLAARQAASAAAAMTDEDGVSRVELVPSAGSGLQAPVARKTEKERMHEGGGAGVYKFDYEKDYLLKEDEWKRDAIPEIMDGMNVADFIDPEIAAKLDALEKEQEQMDAELAGAMDEEEDELGEDEAALATAIRSKKKLARKASRDTRTSHPTLPRGRTGPGGRALAMEDAVKRLEDAGVDASAMEEKRGRKRVRGLSRAADRAAAAEAAAEADAMGDGEGDGEGNKKARTRSVSRSKSRAPGSHSVVAPREPTAMGLKDDDQVLHARKVMKKMNKKRALHAKAGDADRHAGPKLIRHLLEGKMGKGTSRSR